MSTIYKHKVLAGALTFNDIAALPLGAVSCGVDILDGWKSSPDPEVIASDFGVLRDGMELGDAFPLRARYLVVGGWGLAADEDGAERLHDAMVRDAFPRNTLLKMVRYEATPKYVWYRRSSAFDTDWSAVRNGFRWNTTLICADPLKYSVTQEQATAGTAGLSSTGVSFPVTFPFFFTTVTAGATVTTANIVNRGNTPSRSLSAVITGPVTQGNWRLRNDTTNSEIFFDLSLSIGDTLTLDFLNQLAYLNGFPYFGRKTGDWFSLRAGTNELRLYADYNAATTVTITAESAWE